MLSFFRTSRPVVAVCVLVAASMFAADTVVIRSGDTLSELALEHGVTVADLMEWNGIDDPDRILSGTTLLLTPPEAPPERYVVRAGDTLSAIAGRYRITTSRIAGGNGLDDPDLILAGQTLDLTAEEPPEPASSPAATGSYVVAEGDTLSQIAEDHGLRTSELAEANDIGNRDTIRIGTTLVIPARADAEPTTAAPPAEAPAPAAAAAPAPVPTPAPPTTAPAPTPAPPTTAPTPPPPPPAAAPAPAAATAPDNAPLLTPLFSRWAGVYGVEQGLLEALASHESDWRPAAVGPGGHLGIAQLSPDTVAFVEQRLLGLELNPLDSSDGIQMEARYLRYLLDRTSSEREALAAWNQGLVSVQDGGISASGGAFADAVLQIRQQRS